MTDYLPPHLSDLVATITYKPGWTFYLSEEECGRRLMIDLEDACELMHDAYEKAALGAGWETNPASRKPWTDVPEANKETMRAAVGALLVALGGPYRCCEHCADDVVHDVEPNQHELSCQLCDDVLTRRAQAAEAEVSRLGDNLGDLLCELTGGRLSKTNYDVRTMVQAVEEYFQDDVDALETELRVLREHLEALADSWDGGEEVGVAHVVACKDYGCTLCPVIACATDLRAALAPSPAATTGEAVRVPLRWVDEVVIALDSASIIGKRSCRPGDGLHTANHDRLIREAQQWSVYAESAKSLPAPVSSGEAGTGEAGGSGE